MANYKRLTREDRTIIHTMLCEKCSLKIIAETLGKCVSSISREIKAHRVEKDTYGWRSRNRCIHRKDCEHDYVCAGMESICKSKNKVCSRCYTENCNKHCDDYEEEVCEKLSKPPYVCNRCSDSGRCSLRKYVYYADLAQQQSDSVKSESRSGMNITEEELQEIDSLLSDRIMLGQSIHHIFASSPDVFNISEKTAYKLVNGNLISARRMDLPRAVRFRPRKKKSKEVKVDKKCRIGRTYEDYKKYIKEHPDVQVLEGDTVEGRKGGKCVLTLTWVQTDFQIAILRDHNNSASVTAAVNSLYEQLGCDDFHRVFPPVWLLDNGPEFSNPKEIEKFGILVFYCDPSAPYQKGACENTHTNLRRIAPKGTNFDDLDQAFFDLAYSHINCMIRKKLNNHSPYDVFSFLVGDDILQKAFHLKRIPAEKVHLTPVLLRNYKASKEEEK